MSSFFLTTFGQDLKTYDAGMSFITSSKDVNKNELPLGRYCQSLVLDETIIEVGEVGGTVAGGKASVPDVRRLWILTSI